MTFFAVTLQKPGHPIATRFPTPGSRDRERKLCRNWSRNIRSIVLLREATTLRGVSWKVRSSFSDSRSSSTRNARAHTQTHVLTDAEIQMEPGHTLRWCFGPANESFNWISRWVRATTRIIISTVTDTVPASRFVAERNHRRTRGTIVVGVCEGVAKIPVTITYRAIFVSNYKL